MSQYDGDSQSIAALVDSADEMGLQWEMAILLAFLREWEVINPSEVIVSAPDNALWMRLEIPDDVDASVPSRFQSVQLSQAGKDNRVVAQSIVGPEERIAEPALRALLREAHVEGHFRVSIDPRGRLVLVGEFPMTLVGLDAEERESLGFWMLSEIERLALLADSLEQRFFGCDADADGYDADAGARPEGATVH
ncbi:hypothetical protein [Geopseudomonas aromaticivorans]